MNELIPLMGDCGLLFPFLKHENNLPVKSHLSPWNTLESWRDLKKYPLAEYAPRDPDLVSLGQSLGKDASKNLSGIIMSTQSGESLL